VSQLHVCCGRADVRAVKCPTDTQRKDRTLLITNSKRDLGVTLDAQLPFKQHIENVVRSCFYQLRQSNDPFQMTLCAPWYMCSSQGALTALTLCCIRRLNKSRSSAAGSTTRCRSTDHWCSPKSAHHCNTAWHVTLVAGVSAHSVQNCADGVHSQGPSYFGGIMTPVHTVAARARLRSADQGDVVVPHSRTTRFGQCSFSLVAPTEWNDLPTEVKSREIGRQCFKQKLKLNIVLIRNRRLWELCLRGAP